ncbi:hypothetical protein ANCDUO_17483 [Ancylostoma duodenale]|uniref:BTB domain-containing protein n=1 Tax=Ancylostoma duodenale TaxID=51022 RepID=A0A0C2G5T4_9BILA|nr:hypothetical protein ANCDUO_17483 [Ancylostoma duodenale]
MALLKRVLSAETTASLETLFFTFLQELRADGKFCDVELLVGDQSIKSHRVRLELPKLACSEVNDAAHRRTYVCTVAANHPGSREYCLQQWRAQKLGFRGKREIDFSALSSLISYAYGCPLTINGQNVQAVMMTANYFESFLPSFAEAGAYGGENEEK